jgi:glycosyltransferase involved in cell wall biosynthesis
MISAIILTKNEERNIKECLEGLSWCDEKIVIDDASEDRTREIAQKLGAIVYNRRLVDFSDQRNYGLEKAKGDWILFVDADERISQALWYEIMQYINEPIENFSGFFLKRVDLMWGQELKHGEAGTLKLLRLAKKGSGKWVGTVHEKWNISGKIETLDNPLYHYPHETVGQFLSDLNQYTDLRAKELYEQGVRTNWFFILLYPKAKFFLNYVLRLGLLDGLPGLVTALMMSFHSFLVRGKLWLLWENKK